MTEREKFQIYESKRRIFARDNWKCQFPECQERANQVAHRISKKYESKWGSEIIHHDFNLVSTCCQEHNDFFNIGENPGKSGVLIALILGDLPPEEQFPINTSAKKITDYLQK